MYTHTRVSHTHMRRHTSAAERDYVTLLFGIREERKRLFRYLSQPSGLLVSMAAPHQPLAQYQAEEKVAGGQGSRNAVAQGDEGGPG